MLSFIEEFVGGSHLIEMVVVGGMKFGKLVQYLNSLQRPVTTSSGSWLHLLLKELLFLLSHKFQIANGKKISQEVSH